MKVLQRIALLLLMGATVGLLTGCIEQTVLIKVNPDGSGVVRTRMLMNTAAMEQAARQMAESMAASMGGDGNVTMTESSSSESLFNRDELAATARQMGEGVQLLRAKEISRNGKQGFLAEYGFRDISKLRLSSLGGDQAKGGNAQPQYRFEFAPASQGVPASLTVVPRWSGQEGGGATPMMPPTDPGMPPGAPGGGMDQLPPEQQQMMNLMFSGMVFSIYLQVNGDVIETNASHRMYQTPNAITLFYLDMEQLMQAAGQMQQVMQASGSSDISQLSEQNIPGLVVEDPNKQIQIRFQ